VHGYDSAGVPIADQVADGATGDRFSDQVAGALRKLEVVVDPCGVVGVRGADRVQVLVLQCTAGPELEPVGTSAMPTREREKATTASRRAAPGSGFGFGAGVRFPSVRGLSAGI
jgi:hypothetical protein